MSDVASLELSRELYELSGWVDTQLAALKENSDGSHSNIWEPQYSLGFLIRKLPTYLFQDDDDWLLTLRPQFNAGWDAYYAGQSDPRARYYQEADTPENAVAKLAIELLKQGILKGKEV